MILPVLAAETAAPLELAKMIKSPADTDGFVPPVVAPAARTDAHELALVIRVAYEPVFDDTCQPVPSRYRRRP
jgi:hypothetical protein